MNRLGAPGALLLCCIALAGCSEQVLHTGLTENEANELIAVLYSADMGATKVADKGGLFRVDIGRSDFSGAVGLLQSHGLPRERFESLGDVFAKEGFVSSPLEERARLNFALSQEIAKTISNIDGVVMARVHLAVPRQDRLAVTVEPSSASVFVKHQPDVDLAGNIGTIKALVVTAFENLPYENVTVGLFPARPMDQRAPEPRTETILASVNREGSANVVTIAMMSIGLCLLGAGGFLVYRVREVRGDRGRTDD